MSVGWVPEILPSCVRHKHILVDGFWEILNIGGKKHKEIYNKCQWIHHQEFGHLFEVFSNMKETNSVMNSILMYKVDISHHSSLCSPALLHRDGLCHDFTDP